MEIKITRKVEALSMTAEQWELFSDQPGADAAATKLNEAFVAAVNEGKTCHEVRRAVEKVMTEQADFGASDSEPAYHLERLLKKVFTESYDG